MLSYEGPTEVRPGLHRARAEILDAELAEHAADRYLAAHAAVLQAAAMLMVARRSPTRGGGRASRPRNAWRVLAEVAPEFAEWAAFFDALSGKRDAVGAGARAIVTTREADDLLRDAQTFLSLVERAVSRGRSRPVARERAERVAAMP